MSKHLIKKFILAGLGGQGTLFAGKILAESAFHNEYNSIYTPTYGPEVRNGIVNAEVIISKAELYNPFIELANCIVVFHKNRFLEIGKYANKETYIICKDFDPPENHNVKAKIFKVSTDEILVEKLKNISLIGTINQLFDLFPDKKVGAAIKSTLENKPYNIISANYKSYKIGKRFVLKEQK